MSAPRAFLNSNTIRVCAVAVPVLWGCAGASDDRREQLSARETDEVLGYSQRSVVLPQLAFKLEILTSFLEPTKTSLERSLEGNEETLLSRSDESPKKTIVYDFIVIGYGNAGQSAVRTLRKRCPRAKIAIIDPLRSGRLDVEQHRDTAIGFNPNSRIVRLLSDSTKELQYRHAILVATGSRGAPPPLELFAESSLPRVLELKTTELLGNTKRPIMAPEKVRKVIKNAASKGAKIGILGSGWEALDLVCTAEKEGRKKPTITFGNPGPVWNILPQYLSSELRRKLEKRGVDIQDRSVVRYVADIHHSNTQKLELHTAKTYDLLETRRTVLDLLVVAPDSFGAKGTAALPTSFVPPKMQETSDGRPWYKTWSQLTKSSSFEPSVVPCFEDDGRVSVNAELCAASRVYAAGSVAKYPNSSTGNATIAGEGVTNGAEAGRIAATNMSRDYVEKSSFSFQEEESIQSFAASSLPVWRSDTTSYSEQGRPVVSSLSSLGIQALSVGNCDSERLATRGFWWTNSSAQRRIARMIEEDQEDEQSTGDVLKMTGRVSRRRRKLGLVTPLYGIGVVYYLDSVGRIQGILTWGLPFAAEEGGAVNPHLLRHLKEIIAKNAGVSALDAEENHQIMNTALAKQSQKLVSIAVKGQTADMTTISHGLDGSIDGFSTPLYRYTEVNPAKTPSINVLKRKEAGGLGVLGEDLYTRDELAIEKMEADDSGCETATNIPQTMYPITVVPFQVEEAYGKKAASLDSLAELNRYLAVQRGWEDNENRARPGKEDPLWLRPGDERKNTSKRQILIDAYRSIMFPHQS